MTPPNGSSGYTALLRAPASAVMTVDKYASYPAGADTTVGAVIKYVSKSDAENEILCAQLASDFGLNAPVVQTTPDNIAALFNSPMKNAKPSFNPQPFQMLAMNLIRGTNLFELCEDGKILNFSQSVWNRLFFEFGRTAMFDLFIGNFDRFIRFERNSDGTYEIRKANANLGNVMLEWTPERGQNVSTTHMIDSTSAAQEPKLKIEEEAVIFGMVDFFDDETTTSSSAAAAATDLSTTTFTSPPSSPKRKKNDPIAPALHQFFVETMTEFKRGSPELAKFILDSVTESLCNSLEGFLNLNRNDPRIVQLVEHLLNGEDALKKGLAQGFTRLADPDFHSCDSLRNFGKQTTELDRLLSLNIKWLQSQRRVKARPGQFHELMHGCFL